MQHHEEIRHHHFYVEGGGMSCVNSSHVMTRRGSDAEHRD